MQDMVIIENEKLFTTSIAIADGVELEHRAVMQLIKTHYDDLKSFATCAFEMRKLKTKGRHTSYYNLNEEQATFLVTLMKNSKIVIDFKKKLTKEFFKQRNIIHNLISQRKDSDWQNVRKDGKAVYFPKADTIKKYVEYAISQGSNTYKKNPELAYSNLARMQNKALFIFEKAYPNMREVMTIKQLMHVAAADSVIENALKEGMTMNLGYKECFKLAKSRIISYSEMIGKSHILSLGLRSVEKQ